MLSLLSWQGRARVKTLQKKVTEARFGLGSLPLAADRW